MTRVRDCCGQWIYVGDYVECVHKEDDLPSAYAEGEWVMGQIKQIDRRVYVAGDGKEFLDYETACVYEARRALQELLDKHSVGRGGEWCQADFLNFMLEHKDEILLALDPYYG